jgi:hypothetical protein
MAKSPAIITRTTVSFTEDDLLNIEKAKKKMGINTVAGIIRFAINALLRANP